jgi:hypothetical protein
MGKLEMVQAASILASGMVAKCYEKGQPLTPGATAEIARISVQVLKAIETAVDIARG